MNINNCYSPTLSLFNLKIVSIGLNVVLFFVLISVFHSAISLYLGYNSLQVFGVPIQSVNQWEMPFIILFLFYLIAFSVVIFFNIKRKYIISAIISALMILIYFILPLFGFEWLK